MGKISTRAQETVQINAVFSQGIALSFIGQDLVASLIDDEKLGLRIFIETDGCIGRGEEN